MAHPKVVPGLSLRSGVIYQSRVSLYTRLPHLFFATLRVDDEERKASSAREIRTIFESYFDQYPHHVGIVNCSTLFGHDGHVEI